MRSKADQTIIQIIDMVKRIEDIDALLAIEQFVKENEPMTLRTYINCKFDTYHVAIRRRLEEEVLCIFDEVKDELKPSENYIDHFCELFVDGFEIDIWIHEQGTLFNPTMIANIIFKLWTKEIVLR